MGKNWQATCANTYRSSAECEQLFGEEIVFKYDLNIKLF